MKHLTELAKVVLKEEWEPTVVLLGLIATLSTAPYSLTLLILNLCMGGVILYRLSRAIRQALRVVSVKHVPIVVIAGAGHDVAETMWQDVKRVMAKWDFDVERYRRDFDVERDDTVIREEVLPPESGPWLQLARKFKHHVERMSRRLPGRRVFHVFINGPASLGLGLGASIGTRNEAIVHQWFPGVPDQQYQPVVNFHALAEASAKGMHFLEDPVTDECRYVAAEGKPADATDLYVSVWVAHHDPRADVERAAASARTSGQSVATLHISRTTHETLKTDDDWIRCAREILTIFDSEVARLRPQRVHLFLSCPVALAFTIGMGLEHFMPVTVYNWWSKEQSYHPVIPLDHLGRSA